MIGMSFIRGGGSGSVSPIGASLDLIFRDPLGVEFGAPRTIAGTTTVAGWPNLGTFTRASTADWINVAGNGLETQAGNNVLRRGPVRGALFEQGVTAQPVNSSLVGAVAGTPGTLPTGWGVANPTGLTRTLAITNINGVSCLDINWSGTTTSSNLLFVQVPRSAATTGQTWTHNAFTQVTVDDAAVSSLTIQIVEENASLVFLDATTTNLYPTRTTFARRSVTRVFNQATTANVRASYASNSISSGVAVNFTLRIGLPMLNQGELTSPILTTDSGAVTRAADQLVIPVSLPETTWTIAGVATMPGTPTGTVENILNLGIDAGNRFPLRRSSGGAIELVSFIAATAQGGPSTTAPTAGSRFGFCIRRNGTQLSLSLNGGALVNSTPSLPVGAPQTLSVGQNGAGGGQWNSYIERIPVFPTAVSDAEMQTYSTLSTWGA